MTLTCETKNKVSQNSLISLTKIKSQYSSITWLEKIPDNLDIFINTQIHVDIVNNLNYNTYNQNGILI